MSANQFRRSTDTILEDVFHFSNEVSLIKFKQTYAVHLDFCISVEDDNDELLYVIARYDVMILLIENFRVFTNSQKGGSSLHNAFKVLDVAIDELKEEGFNNGDIMHYMMASLNEKLDDNNEREHITDTSGSLFDTIANATKPGIVDNKRYSFFNDAMGRELRVGDLVELIDLKDYDAENDKVGDVLIVTNTDDLASNFIHFKNTRTSANISCFGHRVRAFIQ